MFFDHRAQGCTSLLRHVLLHRSVEGYFLYHVEYTQLDENLLPLGMKSGQEERMLYKKKSLKEIGDARNEVWCIGDADRR